MIEFIGRNKKMIVIGLIAWLIINFGAYRFFYISGTRLLNDLYQKGVLLTQSLASKIGLPLLNNDIPALNMMIRGFEEIEDLYFIEIFDSENKFVTRFNPKTQPQGHINIENKKNIGRINEVSIDALTLTNNDRIVRFAANVNYSKIDIGRVLLALSASDLYSASKNDRTLFIVIVVSSTLVWVLCLWVVYRGLNARDLRRQKEQEDMNRIGPYILVDKIAQGGMAELYKAEHTSEDGFRRIVALKKILPHLTQDQEFINMFIREARIAAFLRHPNVVQITDYGRYKNAYYIAMEYVDGINLAEIMDRIKAGLPIDLTVFLALKIVMGLQYSHSKEDDKSGTPLNIVHRDISPQNVMVSFEGEIKITDFGLAKAQSEPSFTRTGQIKGKQQYMSPEQALGKKVDNRTDIYAFGVVFYEILTGHQLFEFKNDVDAIMSIPTETITPLRAIRPDIHEELNRIVMKCLEKDRDVRYQTAQEIFHDLLYFKKKSNIAFDSTDLSNFMKKYFK